MKLLLSLYFLLFTMSNAFFTQENNSEKTALFYLYRAPKIASPKPPLLILMHGVGSNEEDLFSFANQIPDRFMVVSLRAPYTLGNKSYGWYQVDFSKEKPIINKEQAEASRKAIIQFISALQQEHPFDANNVYLCGFSQGAIMTYSVGLTRPDLIHGMAVMSGRLLDEVKPLIDTTKNFSHLKSFISHGVNDPVLKVQYARDAKNYLTHLHITPTYKEYNEVHGINADMLKDLIRWLQ